MRALRRWLGARPWAPSVVGLPAGLWLRLCHATIRWERRGEAELAAALAQGPVILALWHERLAFAGRDFPGPGIVALHSTRFAGRVAGAAQGVLGMEPVAMDSRAGNLAASREVMRRLRGGTSVGLAVDGSSGPARRVKDPVLDWARATGRPVFGYAFAVRGQRRLDTWDRLVWPRPFRRGVAVWRRWDEAPARRPDAAEAERLRASLGALLTALADEADAAVS